MVTGGAGGSGGAGGAAGVAGGAGGSAESPEAPGAPKAPREAPEAPRAVAEAVAMPREGRAVTAEVAAVPREGRAVTAMLAAAPREVRAVAGGAAQWARGRREGRAMPREGRAVIGGGGRRARSGRTVANQVADGVDVLRLLRRGGGALFLTLPLLFLESSTQPRGGEMRGVVRVNAYRGSACTGSQVMGSRLQKRHGTTFPLMCSK